MFSGVLNERRASTIRYEAASDTASVEVEAASGTMKERSSPAELLLDAMGFLVGVDIGSDGNGRVVVMVGPHEAVNHKKPAKVTVVEADGDVAEVRVPNARAALRAHEKNPYI